MIKNPNLKVTEAMAKLDTAEVVLMVDIRTRTNKTSTYAKSFLSICRSKKQRNTKKYTSFSTKDSKLSAFFSGAMKLYTQKTEVATGARATLVTTTLPKRLQKQNHFCGLGCQKQFLKINVVARQPV